MFLCSEIIRFHPVYPGVALSAGDCHAARSGDMPQAALFAVLKGGFPASGVLVTGGRWLQASGQWVIVQEGGMLAAGSPERWLVSLSRDHTMEITNSGSPRDCLEFLGGRSVTGRMSDKDIKAVVSLIRLVRAYETLETISGRSK